MKEELDLISLEMHLPIIEIEDSGNGAGIIVEVKIGKKEHPSTEEHHITELVLMEGKRDIGKAKLNSETRARVTFYLKKYPENPGIKIRCNKHGVMIFRMNNNENRQEMKPTYYNPHKTF